MLPGLPQGGGPGFPAGLARQRRFRRPLLTLIKHFMHPVPAQGAKSLQAQTHQLFAAGLEFHRQGQLDKAMLAYEQVLRLAPKHFEALHHVGIVAFQARNFTLAAGFIRSALAVNPDVASAHSNLGNALKEMRQFDDALQCYDRAISLEAGNADTYYNRGVVLQALRRFETALHSYDRALAMNANDEQAWNNRAVVLKTLEQYESALESAEQALSLNPNYVEAHSNRGNILRESGQFESALASYDRALGLLPDFADAHYNRGLVLHTLDRSDEAVASYDRALALDPGLAEAYNNRAIALQKLQRYEEALRDCERAIALRPDYIEAYRNRGRVLQEVGRPDAAAESFATVFSLDGDDADAYRLRALALKDARQYEAALECIDRAIALKPDELDMHLAKGVVLRHSKRYDAALESYGKAIALRPDHPAAYTNRGRLFDELNLLEAAMADYDKALALDPECAMARWNRGLLNLRIGRLAQGWRDYEYRWKAESLPVYKGKRSFTEPVWLGQEPVAGKTILLHAEQGLGDTLQFCRYAPLLAQRGATVLLEVKGPLAGLLGSLAGVTQVLCRGDALPRFDFHCPLMSLPLAFGTELATIPNAVPYLSADPARVAHWSTVLGEKTKPRVGIVWNGNPQHQNDSQRSIALSEFMRLLSDRCEFVVLQKELKMLDKAVLGMKPNVRQFCDGINDFSDTAALCELVDVVVTVDTSVAHLAGALGRPVLVLLSSRAADWRWLMDRSDSPWYPSATLYRQQEEGDWAGVIEQVKSQLDQLPLQ